MTIEQLEITAEVSSAVTEQSTPDTVANQAGQPELMVEDDQTAAQKATAMAERVRLNELVSQLQNNGDPEAFESIFKATELGLRQFLRRFSYDLDLIDELVQDTYLKLLQSPNSYRTVMPDSNEPGNLKGWLKTVARNLFISKHRSSKRTATAPLPETDRDLRGPLVVSDESIHESDNHEQVMEILNKIDPLFRHIVALVDVDGYTNTEVAEMLGLSRGTVGSKLLRGRRQAAELLGRHRQPQKTSRQSAQTLEA